MEDVYKVEPSQAREEVDKLEMRLHSRNAVVSIGDIRQRNDRFLCHHASASYGMSGAAACRLDEPHLFVSVHFSAASTIQSLPHISTPNISTFASRHRVVCVAM